MKAFPSTISMFRLRVIFFSKITPRYSYFHDRRGDYSSIQCKLSFMGPKYMRKIKDSSSILIDFYVLVLIPRLNSPESSLQVSENITAFAFCLIYTSGMSKKI
jgi:hypothetical protein